jgi:hypothetical protein
MLKTYLVVQGLGNCRTPFHPSHSVSGHGIRNLFALNTHVDDCGDISLNQVQLPQRRYSESRQPKPRILHACSPFTEIDRVSP